MPIYSEEQLKAAWVGVCDTARELTEANGNPLLFLSAIQDLVSMIYINHAEDGQVVDDDTLKNYILGFNSPHPFPPAKITQLCALALASMDKDINSSNDPIAERVLIPIRTGLGALYWVLHPEEHINPTSSEHQLIKTFLASPAALGANQSFYLTLQQTNLNAFIRFFEQELVSPHTSCSPQDMAEINGLLGQAKNIPPNDHTQLTTIVKLTANLNLIRKIYESKKRLTQLIHSQAPTPQEEHLRLKAYTDHLDTLEQRDKKIKACLDILEQLPEFKTIENITIRLKPAQGKEIFEQTAQLTKLERFLIKLRIVNQLEAPLVAENHPQARMVINIHQAILKFTQTVPQDAFERLLEPLHDILLMLNILLDPNQPEPTLTSREKLLNSVASLPRHLSATSTSHSGGFHAANTTQEPPPSQELLTSYVRDPLNQLAEEMYLLTYLASESTNTLISALRQETERLKTQNVTNYESKMALAKLLQRISTAVASTDLATNTIEPEEKAKKVSQACSDLKKLSDQTKNSPRSDRLNASILQLMGSLLRPQIQTGRYIPQINNAIIALVDQPDATLEESAFEPLSKILLALPKLARQTTTTIEAKEKAQLRTETLHHLSQLPRQIANETLFTCMYNLIAEDLDASIQRLDQTEPKKKYFQQILRETEQLAQSAKPTRKIELTKLLNHVTAVLHGPSQKNLNALQTQSQKIATYPRAKMLGVLLASLILLAIIGACIGMAVVSFGAAAPVSILGLYLGKCIIAGGVASGLGVLSTGGFLTLGVKTTHPNGFFQNKLSEHGIQKNVEKLRHLP